MNGSLPQHPGVLDTALSLDTQLEVWASHLPADRSPTMLPMDPTEYPPWASELFSSPGAPRMMEVFLDPLAVSDWSMYRATRIQLNLSILNSLHAFPESNDKFYMTRLKSRILENISTLCGQIASSVPYLLLTRPEPNSPYPSSTEMIRGIWGYLLTWPVTMAFSCYRNGPIPDIDSQKQWLGSVIRFLSRSLGIAKAEALFEAYN